MCSHGHEEGPALQAGATSVCPDRRTTNRSLATLAFHESFDHGTRAFAETIELARLDEAKSNNHKELSHHVAASRIIERVGQHIVPCVENAKHFEISIVVGARGVGDDRLQLVERALAEPLEGELSKVHPIGFGNIGHASESSITPMQSSLRVCTEVHEPIAARYSRLKTRGFSVISV